MTPLIFLIGQKIRDLRGERGMTLGDLAEQIKVSPSLISQLERGGVNPSISLLKLIADSFHLPLSSLLGEEESKPDEVPHVMKERQRKVLTTEGGVKFVLLSGSYDLGCEFICNEWPAGSSTGKEKFVHEGVESGYVLSGQLRVELGDQVYPLKSGDSITYPSTIPHLIRNPTKRKTIAVWVNSIPWIFRNR
jgi:transcriptional regulator with XRE-family HTH domain